MKKPGSTAIQVRNIINNLLGRADSRARDLWYFNDVTKDKTTRRVKVVICDAAVCESVAQQLPNALDKAGIEYLLVRANEPSGVLIHSGFARYVAVKLPVYPSERGDVHAC